MDFSEKTFSVEDSAGNSLYGIVHEPEKPNNSLIVMFNIGLHYRVAHSRLFVLQARDLQKSGFTVARFDTTGIGYSHGEMPRGRAIDSFDSIQTGLFKDDSQRVLRYLKDKYNPEKIFLSGLCGGALTAIITAALEKYVDGVVFIAGPVTITSPEFELKSLHPFEANELVSGYVKRLASPRSWIRFISGKTSYRDIWSSLKVKITEHFASRKPITSDSTTDDTGEENKGNLLNRVFLEAFDEMMKSNRSVLFAMPQLDKATYDFDKLFLNNILSRYDQYSRYYDIARVEKADHTFSRPESSAALFDLSREWFLRQIGS